MHLVKQLIALTAVAFHQFRQCGDFCLQRIDDPICLGPGSPCTVFLGQAIRPSRLRLSQSRFGLGDGLNSGRLIKMGLRVGRCGVTGLCAGLSHRRLGIDLFGLSLGQAFLGILNEAIRRLMAGGETGYIFGNLRQLRFTIVQNSRRL